MATEVPDADIPLEGLSQDIIEWDESNNVDLRTLYPSPLPDGNRESTRDSPSVQSQNSSIFSRKTQRQPMIPADSTIVNLDRTFRDASLQNEREQLRQKRLAGAEKEIDSIFGILRMEEHHHPDPSSSPEPDPDAANQSDSDNRTLKRRNSSPSEMATQPQTNKRQAVGELKRRRSHPPFHKTSRATVVLRERLRKRMVQKRRHRPHHRSNDYPPLHPNSKTDNTCLSRSNGSILDDDTDVPESSTKQIKLNQDAFSEILDALKTPKDANHPHPQPTSRAPLTTMDGNTLQTELIHDTTAKRLPFHDIDNDVNTSSQSSRVSISPQVHPPVSSATATKSTSTRSTTKPPPLMSRHPQASSTHEPCPSLADRQAAPSVASGEGHVESTRPAAEPAASNNENADDDDDYGDVTFTVDDLAMIDSLAGASLSNNTASNTSSQGPTNELSSMKNDSMQRTTNSEVSPIERNHHEQEEEDEFLLHPNDFAKIDALVAEKTKPKVGMCEDKSSSVTKKSPSRSDQKLYESDEEDNYKNLFENIDYSKIDAMIASQSGDATDNCCQNDAGKKSNVEKTEKDDLADDYDDFVCDIDIDALVASKLEERKLAATHNDSPSNGRAVRNGFMSNIRAEPLREGNISFTRYTRYKVTSVVDDDARSNTKKVFVASWNHSMSKVLDNEKKIHRYSNATRESMLGPMDAGKSGDCQPSGDGFLVLAGEWYHTPVQVGDVVNLCSLFGRYCTDKSALPVTLHTFPPPGSDVDDLVLVLHPDMMMTPSTISEASYCTRRAVLKSKLGSTGLTSKAALVGTLVHAVFEECLKGGRFDMSFAEQAVKRVLHEKAEMVIGCDCSESEIEQAVLNVVPAIRQFALHFTTLIHDSDGHHIGGVACHPDIHFLGQGVHSVEESIVSTELGLKGDVDAVLEVETKVIGERKALQCEPAGGDSETKRNLMCLELKTGHNQTAQRAHLAQLSLYTFMLQSRYGAQISQYQCQDSNHRSFQDYGAASSGVLLYLNENAQEIYHVAPEMNEIKTLLSQRNVVASELQQASQPRGISLSFEEGARENGVPTVDVKLLPPPPAKLPDLTDNDHSCKRCFSNRECMLYAASGSTSDNQSHRELLTQFTGHLTPLELEYFRNWERLIDIEADATSTSVTAGWLFDSESREESGDSISGLRLDQDASLVDNNGLTATVCFYREKGSQSSPLNGLGFSPGSNVIVSTDATLENGLTEVLPHNSVRHRMHIAKGSVDRVDEERVFVLCKSGELCRIEELVDRQHRVTESTLLFRIDKNQNSVGTGTLRWNLINFLSGDAETTKEGTNTQSAINKKARLPWLRDVVIRLKEPEFESIGNSPLFEGIDCDIPGCRFEELLRDFELLNEAQQRAVWKVMSATDYTLIQGLPGTGKSSTISFLARLLVARGKRVLLTAYTHSAVDNIMMKLLENGMGDVDSRSGMAALVRVSQPKSCHEDVKSILYTELATKLEAGNDGSAVSLKKTVSNARVVGVSALSLPRSSVLQNEHFHVVIVDEAGQMNQPVALGALMAADSFILVGDNKQLPPLVNSEIAEAGGYGVSMMSRLAEKHPSAIAPLTLQYRMNEEICKVSSEAFYGGLMKCGDEKVRYQRLVLPGFPDKLRSITPTRNRAWLKSAIDPNRPVVFLDTDTVKLYQEESPGNSTELQAQSVVFDPLEGKLGGRVSGNTVNETEANVVHAIIEALVHCGMNCASVGVISPFRAQIRIMEESDRLASFKRLGLELSTIDRFQGRDKDVIILSMVRSNKKGNTGRLLQDARRLNVAFTRAKCKLIIVGSIQTLCMGSPPLKPIINRMKRRQEIVPISDSI